MKRILNTILVLSSALLLASCHEPEYVQPDENATKGIIAIKAIFPSGTQYADKVLGTLNVTDPDADYYAVPIPWYYPETSDDLTLTYMTDLRINVTLAPNYKLVPGVVRLDLTEENEFTLEGPDGFSKKIVITGDRRLPSTCELVTFSIPDVLVDGIIDNSKKTILIPYLDDLSSVHVTGQVSPHATLAKIGNKAYKKTSAYDLNAGQTVTVLAEDGVTEGVYTVTQGNPELIDMGINSSSFAELFNIDPVALLGLPDYKTLTHVSLAGNGSNIVVCVGEGEPVLVNRFNGAKAGTMKVGEAEAVCIAGDESEHILITNFAESGGTINLYRSDDPAKDPVLFHSFVNPLDASSGTGIGHRMKIIGNLDTEAVITFTTEGISEVTSANRALYLKVKGGVVVGEPQEVSFAFTTVSSTGWGSAPVGVATVVPASLEPAQDGWFLDFYEGNAVSGVEGDNYVLHYFDKDGKDNSVTYYGNWANNSNCLDTKRFNNATFMTLLSVSHFPNWGTGPKFRLYEITDPTAPTLIADLSPEYYQKGDFASGIGASGDICLCPSADGFRIFLYYYDHHSQSLAAYVADCIKK